MAPATSRQENQLMRYARIIPLLIAAPLGACMPSDQASNGICGPRIHDCATTANDVQKTITATGHRCDTVDWVGKLSANDGFYFSCNRHSLSYQIAMHEGR
jgi:hypothetical protein